MITAFLIANLTATIAVFAIAVLFWRKLSLFTDSGNGISQLVTRLDEQQRALNSIHSLIRDEFGLNRGETANAFRGLREEVGGHITSLSNSNNQRSELLREGLHHSQKEQTESLVSSLNSLSNRLQQSQSVFSGMVEAKFNSFQESADNKMQQVRSDLAENSRALRDETRQTFRSFGDSLRTNILEMTQFQKTESEQLRSVVDQRLHTLQIENGQKLEQMRQTVDEKLQGTLEARLGESFKQVSDRLEQVHRGLGEMQSLATGVGDLKRVLTNVKSRGIWGEIQLGNLLEQTLAPEQFERNVPTVGTSERVEYAIKLPGGFGSESHVWLPIDSKFPMEDYQRLVDASERADIQAMECASRELEGVFKTCAKNIKEKYLSPPATTDFGILFLPTESLYAEAIRRDGLVEFVQREHRVIFAGPTTLSALLSSLRMGFRTLAIQQRTTEVWDLLGTVKNEFGKYADLLGKVKKKLEQASNSIDDAERKTRTIHRKLRSIESPHLEKTSGLLPAVGLLNAADESDEDDGIEFQATA